MAATVSLLPSVVWNGFYEQDLPGSDTFIGLPSSLLALQDKRWEDKAERISYFYEVQAVGRVMHGN